MFSEYSKQTDTSRQSDCLRDEMFSAATIEAFRGGGWGGGGGEGVMLSPSLSIAQNTYSSRDIYFQ